MNAAVRGVETIGRGAKRFVEEAGGLTLTFFSAFRLAWVRPFGIQNLLRQMETIGVGSIPVALITAAFTGMVLALQSHTGFSRFNAESLVGTVVALSMTRELGPVLTGLIVAGRAGAAMAAELGTMQVTEQIDALATMGVNPVKYLISPRLLASLIMLPILTALSDIVGVVGGFLVSVYLLDANAGVYRRRTTQYLELNDIMSGIMKAAVFGVIIATVSCYKGFSTKGGAEGVGRATTSAVVVSELSILIANYFLTALMF